MSPFAHMVTAARIPPWSGPSRIHTLDGPPAGRTQVRETSVPRHWVPWTLLTAENATEENFLLGLKCWRLIRPRLPTKGGA